MASQPVAEAGTYGANSFAGNAKYTMLPYFWLGVLQACPPTGRIACWMEESYGYAGADSLARYISANANWVANFFPSYSGLIQKMKTCWVNVPIIYLNCHFQDLGFSYASDAKFISATVNQTPWTDQQIMLTRNALHALNLTPPGYMPAVYSDGSLLGSVDDPWGRLGSVLPMSATAQVCLNNALALSRGTTTWNALGINLATFQTSAVAGWVANGNQINYIAEGD